LFGEKSEGEKGQKAKGKRQKSKGERRKAKAGEGFSSKEFGFCDEWTMKECYVL